jgi:hypothetical protein
MGNLLSPFDLYLLSKFCMTLDFDRILSKMTIYMQVNQKDTCIVPEQDIQFHVVRERSRPQDVGLRFHPLPLNSGVTAISSMLLSFSNQP